MNYKHFITNERALLESYKIQGLKNRECARRLNKHESTISRELKCCKLNKYTAKQAILDYKKQRRKCGNKKKLSFNQRKYINYGLKNLWSPEQIIGRFKQLTNFEKGNFGFNYSDISLGKSISTIYRYIKIKAFSLAQTTLRHYKTHTKPKFTNDKRHIWEIKRDKFDFGHFEADLIVGKNNKSYKLTITERLTNLNYICHLDDKASSSINKNLINFFKNSTILKYAKSLTLDNGSEFAMWKEFEQDTGIPIYFTAPSSPWKKGTIEHENKLFRQRYPKHKNLNKYSEKYDKENIILLNNRPRKKLNFKTPVEVFQMFSPYFDLLKTCTYLALIMIIYII
ncbi:IS30 family transposase [Spiroplasma chrysopicola]|uniref:Transposase, IS30 family n=1 Tax=Spiroplasma chrysopicola DF-1 TaxID=1276227 RepID=R4UIX5_9MOLU|nr:IS30 family transposase [Spiroplasma chrysopicola]AGM25261.1 transposase, IS30 family [Spiroplasma chrysopicola DF-1]